MIRTFFSSFAIALTTLTIVPVPYASRIAANETTFSLSTIFFPVVGAFIGLFPYAVALMLGMTPLGHGLTALIVIALPYVLTKFLHFDGFCDLCDAFLADRSREERLVILKDSRIGSFALGCGTLLLIARFEVVRSLIADRGLLVYLILAPILARFAMVTLATLSRYPRESGTGKPFIGKIDGLSFTLSTSLTLALASIAAFEHLSFSTIGVMFALTLLIGVAMRTLSYRKIGGVTGDCLGATGEIVELAVLVVPLVSR